MEKQTKDGGPNGPPVVEKVCLFFKSLDMFLFIQKLGPMGRNVKGV